MSLGKTFSITKIENTYTIEQIRTYLLSQDSLGDILYNLKNIDSILKNIEEKEAKDAEDFDIKQEEFYK